MRKACGDIFAGKPVLKIILHWKGLTQGTAHMEAQGNGLLPARGLEIRRQNLIKFFGGQTCLVFRLRLKCHC